MKAFPRIVNVNFSPKRAFFLPFFLLLSFEGKEKQNTKSFVVALQVIAQNPVKVSIQSSWVMYRLCMDRHLDYLRTP
jgi:hypothetical protein